MGVITRIIRCFCCEVVDDEQYHNLWVASQNTPANGVSFRSSTSSKDCANTISSGVIDAPYQQYLSNLQESRKYNSSTSDALQKNRASSQSSVSFCSSTSSKDCANTISSGVIDAHYQQYLSNLQESGKYNSSTSDALLKNRASSQSSFQESGKYYSGTSNALQQNRASSQSSSQESGNYFSSTSDALQKNRANSQSSFKESRKYYSGTSDAYALQQNRANSQLSFRELGKYCSGTSDALQQNRVSSQLSFHESCKYYSGTSDALQPNRASSRSIFLSHEHCNTQQNVVTLLSRSSSTNSIDSEISVCSCKSEEGGQEAVKNLGEIVPDVFKNVVVEERWIKFYSSGQKILLVGDGDFSFSASLAKAFGSARNMIATSLDSREFLRQNYRQAISNIQELERRGCRVIHGMDCTEMAKNVLLEGSIFDRIIYNFPFAGFFKNMSRESQLCLHQELVSQFMENAKKMICKKGEIHITHKVNGFLRDWNLEHLAVLQGLKLIEAVHFNRIDYPGYRTKYGFGGDKNFNCNPSKTYKFCLRNC